MVIGLFLCLWSLSRNSPQGRLHSYLTGMAIEKVKQVRLAPNSEDSLQSWAAHTGEPIDIIVPSFFLQSRIKIWLCLRSFTKSEYPHQLFWGLRLKVAVSSRLESAQHLIEHAIREAQNIAKEIDQISCWNFTQCEV